MMDRYIPVHREPDCGGVSSGCSYSEPHRHGFDCDDDCYDCNGCCHYMCPAHPRSNR